MYNALHNAVEYLKSQRIIKKDIEIATRLDISRGTVSNYLTGRIQPSKAFVAKFEKEFNLNLKDFVLNQSMQNDVTKFRAAKTAFENQGMKPGYNVLNDSQRDVLTLNQAAEMKAALDALARIIANQEKRSVDEVRGEIAVSVHEKQRKIDNVIQELREF